MIIASFVLSIIAVSITVFNCYMQYFYRKEEILLTISDAKIENNQLEVLLLYTNTGNQVNTITNASIQLETNEKIHFEHLNYTARLHFNFSSSHNNTDSWFQLPYKLAIRSTGCHVDLFPVMFVVENSVPKLFSYFFFNIPA